MKLKFCLGLFAIAHVAVAQTDDVYAPVLQQIEANNLSLISATQRSEAAKLANSTSLTPSDPEVELGYLWGRPGEKGNRKDVSVSQAFDFPTVYSRKRKLSSEKNRAVNYELSAERAEILLKAKTTCIELIYSNAMLKLCEGRRNRADSLAASMQRMLDNGEVTQLDYNKALLNLTRTETELQRVADERNQLLEELKLLNGGIPIDFTATRFPDVALPADFNEWYATAAESNPTLLSLQQNSRAAETGVAVTKAETLPKLSLGYIGEFEKGTSYQGVTFGFSVPLWENRRRVAQAKAEALATKNELDDARLSHKSAMEGIYRQASTLSRASSSYRVAISNLRNDILLQKSYNLGQISLHEYLEEMNEYFTFVADCLQTERDYQLCMARLFAHTL